MRNLVQFIVRNVHWLLFLLLLFVSLFCLIKNSQFQRSKYLVATQEVSGRLYSVTNELWAFFSLKKENQELTRRVAELEMENLSYVRALDELQHGQGLDSLTTDKLKRIDFEFVSAKVVYNNTSGKNNYLSLKKGSDDGITPDMGVMSATGIVGVIKNVTPNFSLVIPILSSEFRPSCKIKNKNYFGPLTWDGADAKYSYLEELPRHADFQIGDTIVTSGYSNIFPEGLPVGIIVGSRKQEKDDNYTSLKVELFTDFSTLTNAIIVVNRYGEEQRMLEGGIRE
ncbi:rod shape-determining protein MreC [Bacteroidales bacterium OttesenSCG-928-J19]|nr:rod shape-determining protein MreC [Bacteroidales bacterium OttesenSCG-928-J19]